MNFIGTKSLKYFVYIVIGVFTLLSIKGIMDYPSWFDEAVMADISYNLYEIGVWKCEFWPVEKAWSYGPVYFFMQLPFIHFLGFNEISVRVVNAIATYLVGFLIFKLIKVEVKRGFLLYLSILLYFLDISILKVVSIGRMDMLASLFAFLSFYLVVKYKDIKPIIVLLIGLVSALCFLTTPRAIFLLSGTFFVFIFNQFNSYSSNKKHINLLLTNVIIGLISFLTPILIWINYIGGFHEYMDNYLGSQTLNDHIGITIFRNYLDYLYLPFLFFLVVFNFSRNSVNLYGALFTILIYSLFAKELGDGAIYRPLVLPFIIYSLTISIQFFFEVNLKTTFIKLYLVLIFLIGGMNMAYLGLDLFFVNNECRKLDEVLQLKISKLNESDAFILADFEFYFPLRIKVKTFYELWSSKNFPFKHSIKTYIYESNFYDNRKKGLPDAILLTEESYRNIKSKDSTWFTFLNNKYEVTYLNKCSCSFWGLEKVVRPRRTFAGPMLLELKGFKK